MTPNFISDSLPKAAAFFVLLGQRLWQTDFTDFKVLCRGWFYLSSILGDLFRHIVACRLTPTMTSDEQAARHHLQTMLNSADGLRLSRLLVSAPDKPQGFPV